MGSFLCLVGRCIEYTQWCQWCNYPSLIITLNSLRNEATLTVIASHPQRRVAQTFQASQVTYLKSRRCGVMHLPWLCATWPLTKQLLLPSQCSFCPQYSLSSNGLRSPRSTKYIPDHIANTASRSHECPNTHSSVCQTLMH